MAGLLELTAIAERNHFWYHGFRASVVPVLREIAAGRRDLRLLDCGFGTGYNLQHLLRPYGKAFGFDLSEDAIHRGRAARLPIARGNMHHIPFRTGEFDIATSFDVVQSVPDDRAALREMARVLKPGGHVVLNVTALDFLRGDHSDVWGELRRYNPGTARELLASAGLQPVRIAFVFASILPMVLGIRLAQRMMRVVRGPGGGEDLQVPAAPVNTGLAWLVRGEAALARRVPMPFGSSLMIVGRKI
jgi:ubiquinone/menaquinone biosynthesis C-methylase UbiE